jgi:sensor histidine kinase regulating citrate/malate metabolism
MNTNAHDIVPTHLAVQAMRDNGYKNAAYAIAELMDNAIQAGASQVELLCGERKQQVEGRKRSRIEQIAVLDNGRGMDANVLRLALQFGNGTHLDEDKHTGIGRFGMGLPSSSISQCQRVDVWSWQNGLENILHTYLDLPEFDVRK